MSKKKKIRKVLKEAYREIRVLKRFILKIRAAAGLAPGDGASLRNVVYGMALRCGMDAKW